MKTLDIDTRHMSDEDLADHNASACITFFRQHMHKGDLFLSIGRHRDRFGEFSAKHARTYVMTLLINVPMVQRWGQELLCDWDDVAAVFNRWYDRQQAA